MKRTLLIVGLVLLSATMLCAQPAAEKKYSTLQMYAALDTEEAQYYIEAFEKSSGIKVEFVRMSSGEVGARIEAEKNNPQASVWFGGSNTDHINAHSKGLLMSYKPNTDFELAPMLHADDYGWNGFYTGAIGFVTNTEFLKKHNISAPQSWADLLDPVYHGQIDGVSGQRYRVHGMGDYHPGQGFEGVDCGAPDKNIHVHRQRNGVYRPRRLGRVCRRHRVLPRHRGEGRRDGVSVIASFLSEGTGYEVGGVSMIMARC